MNDASQAIIAENIGRLREQIQIAAEQSGRRASDVRLVAVTKYVDVDLTRAVLQGGCLDLGESRPQALWQKAAELKDLQPRWHLIGHLQRNKVRRTLPLLHCLHSIDSERLLSELQSESARGGFRTQGLLEVNISGDASKTGLAPQQARRVLDRLDEFPDVELIGLMGMASLDGDLAAARRDFARLRSLRESWQNELGDAVNLRELSMGMSHDFREAIAEGATLVRIGSSLFEGVTS